MTAVPPAPGVGPRSYQLVRNGVLSDGTAGAPSAAWPSEMTRACTWMAGMARDTGRDRGIGRGRDGRPGWPAWPTRCAWTARAAGRAAGRPAGTAMARGGSGGGAQRNV